MSSSELSIFVGVDWGNESHKVCVMDHDGAVIGKQAFDHSAKGLADLVAWLIRQAKGEAARLLVAIERTDGPVVETLMSMAVSAGTVKSASDHVLAILPRLRLAHEQLQQATKKIAKLLQQLRQPADPTPTTTASSGATSPATRRPSAVDVNILASFPGVGNLVLATLLTEVPGEIIDRRRHAVRGQSGIAPVTKQSGKSKYILMRRACNARLRYAFYHWSRSASQHDPRAKEHYRQLRQKGHSHARSLRGVADRLLKVLFSMLERQTAYDAAKRQLPASAA